MLKYPNFKKNYRIQIFLASFTLSEIPTLIIKLKFLNVLLRVNFFQKTRKILVKKIINKIKDIFQKNFSDFS